MRISAERQFSFFGKIFFFVSLVALSCALASCKDKSAMSKYLTDEGVKKMQEKEYDAAKSNFDYAIMADPGYAEAYLRRGELELIQEDYASAAGDFHTASNLFSDAEDKASALSAESEAVFKSGRWEDAYKIAVRSTELNPQCLNCFYRRGIAEAELGDHTSALGSFEKCRQINPNYIEAALAEAAERLETGDYRKASSIAEAYVDATGEIGIEAAEIAAYSAWGMGKRSEAKTIFDSTASKHRFEPAPPIGQGKIALAAGDLDAARGFFNNAVWTNIYSSEAYLARCAVEYLAADLSTAYDDCSRAKSGYSSFAESGRAMIFSWMVLSRQGKTRWANQAVADFISARNPVAWRTPVLKYAAGKIDEKTLLDETAKSKLGGKIKLCEAYFIIAESKLISNPESASADLNRAIGACPPFSLECIIAGFQLRKR